MQAMILAAGKGERMRPLTNDIPKPLLEVTGKPLIVHQLEALIVSGVDKVVINLGYLGEQIRDRLGDGCAFNTQIQYSDEGDAPLETAGGIVKALPYLGEVPFIVANADIYTDFDYASLPTKINSEAHLVLVDNPPYHDHGDFVLDGDSVFNQGERRLTYSGIAVFHPRFFKNCQAGGRYPLVPLLRQLAEVNGLRGQYFKGFWSDVGTPKRLEAINKIINERNK